ncbi:MAG: hypothetical protein KF895_00940 [Parvibaculum sp.]|nr:hypothetical protein [Parvibaculum sp.]
MRIRIRIPKIGPYALLLIAAIALAPVYVFPSGLPQPGDFLMVLWIVVTFFTMSRQGSRVAISPDAKFAVLAYLAFVVWVWTVSLVNGIIHEDAGIAFAPLFYTFNFLVFTAFTIKAAQDHEGFRRLLVLALMLCASVLFLLVVTGYDAERMRQLGGFNNPNQLGYFSVLLLASFAVIADRREMLGISGLVVAVCCIFGVMGSVSFGAIAALLAVLGGAALKILRGNPFKTVTQLLLGAFALVAVFGLVLGDFMVTRFQAAIQRSARFDNKVNMEGFRGYDRIFDYDYYLLFGAGEKGLWRFGTTIELHSSFGTIVFSYGIVGILLVLVLVIAVFRRVPLHVLAIAVGPALYQVTHQGLRTTFLWIFLALVLSYGGRAAHRVVKRPAVARTPVMGTRFG